MMSKVNPAITMPLAVPTQFGPVSTIGMAVKDLYAAMKMYWETFGWGPWNVFRQQPPGLTDTTYLGKPVQYSALVAGTSLPGQAKPGFWLCQPLEGPSLYRQFLEEGFPGPHFLTLWRETEEDSAVLKRLFAGLGASEVMTGRVPGFIQYSFWDTRSALGIMFETGSGASNDQPREATYP